MEIEKLLEKLSNAECIGNINEAALIAEAELKRFAKVSRHGTVGIVGKINKGKQKTLLLDAHIDEVGFVVTAVLGGGFVKVSNVGGIDPRILPANRVVIHGKEKVSAVFTSTPPHLAKKENEAVTLEDIYLDTALGQKAEELISVGDFVTFDSSFTAMGKNFTGKSFDDRAAVACLLEVASRIYDKDLPMNVIISLSEQEELGCRGAATSAFDADCDEAIALDVSFGTAPGIPSHESGKLGGGVMIGISPVLSKKMTDKLTEIAKNRSIAHQFEVMGGKTSTDADVISITKGGIPSALLSVPLRNMHTPVEVINKDDLASVCDLLEAYIMGGGAND